MDSDSENQFISFVKVWAIANASLIYCFTVGKFVRKGIPRLICTIPVICLFLALPLKLTSVVLRGPTAFFLAWLANFKLLLFALGLGPLGSSELTHLSLFHFVAVACLPIKINNNDTRIKPNMRNYAVKVLVFAAIARVYYEYSKVIGGTATKLLFSFIMYLFLDIILTASAAAARAALGAELEPQFNKPFMSTSLQDFWGRRWNLMVTRILRPTVYDPILAAASKLIGRDYAAIPAVLGTFAVSAVMHELMFFYLGRLRPTWEVTWFFALHGFGVVVEIIVKRGMAGRFALPNVVSCVLTVAFVLSSAIWLFFPPLLRLQVDVRAIEEYIAVSEFVTSFTSPSEFV